MEYNGDIVYRFKNFRNPDKISFLINKRIGEVNKSEMLAAEEGEKAFHRCVDLRNYYVRTSNYSLACFYQIEAIYLLTKASFCFYKRKKAKRTVGYFKRTTSNLIGFL